jgi:hypothetical protein
MTDSRKKKADETPPEDELTPEAEAETEPEEETEQTPEPEEVPDETETEPEEVPPETETEPEAPEPEAEEPEPEEEPVAEAPEPVMPKVKVVTSVVGPIETLKLGETFTLDGELYRLFSKEADFAIASKIEKSPDGENWIDRWQRPVLYGTEIIVTPV